MIHKGVILLNYNKYIIISIVTVLLVFVILFSISNNDDNAPESFEILKEYNGKVALYDSNNTTPVSVYDIYIDSLPERDRKSLTEGIKIESEIHLDKILQDYDY